MSNGAVAQLGERLICIQEVVGSIPISSTILRYVCAAQSRIKREYGFPDFKIRAIGLLVDHVY